MLQRLLTTFKTIAFLCDVGHDDEAYQLLDVIDEVAMTLDLYTDKQYQLGRTVLLTYMEPRFPDCWQ